MDGSVGSYEAWILDFNRRLALHDESVALLAADAAARTGWTVRARATPGFEEPPNGRHVATDVRCDRGERPPLCIEVELLETLARRATLRQLRRLLDDGLDARVALVADPDEHEGHIGDASRLLKAAGLRVPVAAVAPRSGAITGADW